MSASNLMHQASMTSHEYLLRAIRNIDSVFGEGYALNHPELVGAVVLASAADFAACFLREGIDQVCSKLGDEK